MAAQGFPVAVTCRVVGVSRSGFYDWVGREPSARSVRDAQLLELVQWSHERSRGTYGARGFMPTSPRSGECPAG